MSLPNLLSLNFLVPYVASKVDFSRAIRGLRGMPRRLLLVGHKLAAGAATANLIQTVSSDADAVYQFGEGSMLVAMWRAAKANADLGLPIDCIVIPQGPAAVAASSTLVLANAAGAALPLANSGEVMLYIGGQRVSLGVTTADTQATVATKLINIINAQPNLPVVAAATGNAAEVKLTCRWGGPSGNDIDVRNTYYLDDRMPSGLTLTVPAMSLGAVTPDLSPLIAAMAGYRATEIVNPFTDSPNMVLLETELGARWAANNMQDGAVVTCIRGTEGVNTTWLNQRNSAHVHTIAVTKDATNPWETAAMAGAAIESQAAIDPAIPATGIALQGYKGPSQGNHWTVDQLNNMLVAGGSPLQIAMDYTGSLLRMVTNYKRTSGGAADRSMSELCWIKTMSYYRWFRVTEFKVKYQGFKLAQYITEAIPGQKIMTKQLGEEIMIGLYKLFMDAGLCQNMDYYRTTLQVEVDGPNGKLKIVDEPVIVTQHYQTEITSYVVAGAV
ncbi:MAG: phage tail protein [Burkholderiaceae bacterium]|nr:phage tail protein [Burkholderiaceae bacterium]